MRKKKERVEDDRFRECDRQNSVDNNRRKRAGVATYRGSHPETGEADTDSYAHCGKADVNASGHFCQ
jgi:hypothetical protein